MNNKHSLVIVYKCTFLILLIENLLKNIWRIVLAFSQFGCFHLIQDFYSTSFSYFAGKVWIKQHEVFEAFLSRCWEMIYFDRHLSLGSFMFAMLLVF